MVKCSRSVGIKLSDLWVGSHEKLSDFYASSWQRGDSAVPLLLIRVVLLVIALSILCWSLYEAPTFRWLIFLTNWGLVLVSTMLVSAVVVSVMAVLDKKTFESDDKGFLPWYVSMYWFCSNVGVTMAILISCLYWILIFDAENMMTITKHEGISFLMLDILTHVVNSSLALIELMAARTPVEILHILQPLAIGLWYAAFTGIYYVSGGTDGKGMPYIYEVLDWRDSEQAAIVVGLSAIGLLLIFGGVYGLALARDTISTWLFRSSSVQLTAMPPDLPTLNGLV